MTRYSAFAIVREALRGNAGWPLVGAGGHGLATAYYLGRNHGITNVAVIEKGWLGGGNTGRNTTIIRSNYLQDPSAAIYEKARSLYETLSQDLNYNVMFSPRGVMMLAQTDHEVPRLPAHGACQRAAGRVDGVHRACSRQGTVPDHQHRGPALPGAGRALAAARRHGAPRRGRLGLCAGLLGHGDGHHPADRGDGRPARGRQGRRASTPRRGRSIAASSASWWRGIPASWPRWRASACRSNRWRCRRWSPSRSSR
jgi:sarcosine oxidase subunit beta